MKFDVYIYSKEKIGRVLLYLNRVDDALCLCVFVANLTAQRTGGHKGTKTRRRMKFDVHIYSKEEIDRVLLQRLLISPFLVINRHDLRYLLFFPCGPILRQKK
jgi:hypothetical protein